MDFDAIRYGPSLLGEHRRSRTQASREARRPARRFVALIEIPTSSEGSCISALVALAASVVIYSVHNSASAHYEICYEFLRFRAIFCTAQQFDIVQRDTPSMTLIATLCSGLC